MLIFSPTGDPCSWKAPLIWRCHNESEVSTNGDEAGNEDISSPFQSCVIILHDTTQHDPPIKNRTLTHFGYILFHEMFPNVSKCFQMFPNVSIFWKHYPILSETVSIVEDYRSSRVGVVCPKLQHGIISKC